tara:strand:+ start:675 stop:1232 length:558 start_codon:yes stop_codon:yes gene_type:complete
MHNNLPRSYYFINKFDPYHLNNIDNKIAIIYREYHKKIDDKLIIKIKDYCKKKGKKFLISNNYKLAIKHNLDGVYLPSFNKNCKYNNFLRKKNFIILGSAHNVKEIREKEAQNVQAIFISSLFNKKKNFLGLNKFKNLIFFTKKKVVALGGINKSNVKKAKLANIYGIAGISFFSKKKAPKKGAL